MEVLDGDEIRTGENKMDKRGDKYQTKLQGWPWVKRTGKQ